MIYRRRGSVSSGFLIIGIMMFFLAVSVSPVQGATFRVNDFSDAVDAINGDGVCETAPGNRVCTLRAAIQEANALAGRDVVILKRGIYLLTIEGRTEDSGTTGDLDIRGDLVLKGKGSKKTFINGNRHDRVLHVIGAEVVIKDLTIQNGLALEGFSGAGAGGGIANSGGTVTIVRCAIANNMAQGAGASFGGGIANLAEGSLVIRDSVVSNNSALGDGGEARGGGIYSASVALVIRNSTIADNQAMASGGAFGGGLLAEGTTEISDSTISGNVASSVSSGASGGGMYLAWPDSVVSNCRISGNRAISETSWAEGGGALFLGGIIGNSTFSDNEATGRSWGYGGGLIFYGRDLLTVLGSTLARNAATTYGGGIYFTGSLTIEQGSRIIRNLAGVEGGGVYNSGGTLNVSNDSAIKHNSPDDTNF